MALTVFNKREIRKIARDNSNILKERDDISDPNYVPYILKTSEQVHVFTSGTIRLCIDKHVYFIRNGTCDLLKKVFTSPRDFMESAYYSSKTEYKKVDESKRAELLREIARLESELEVKRGVLEVKRGELEELDESLTNGTIENTGATERKEADEDDTEEEAAEESSEGSTGRMSGYGVKRSRVS